MAHTVCSSQAWPAHPIPGLSQNRGSKVSVLQPWPCLILSAWWGREERTEPLSPAPTPIPGVQGFSPGPCHSLMQGEQFLQPRAGLDPYTSVGVPHPGPCCQCRGGILPSHPAAWSYAGLAPPQQVCVCGGNRPSRPELSQHQTMLRGERGEFPLCTGVRTLRTLPRAREASAEV